MPLNAWDIAVLTQACQATEGFLPRNALFKACKRGGADIRSLRGILRLTFQEHRFQASTGDISLEDGTTFRDALRDTASAILSENGQPVPG